ncbi:MAG TPA: DUF72 domain-containing protein [Thermodesulfobacteriota bacterium]|nr:DUF72 domain-containing protein [Thermodesulfobacteriota bacterium]
MSAGRVWVGCSGWDYPHWRGVFYPADLPRSAWFAHYAATFATVELNATFYRLPDPATVARWRNQAPPGFRYAVKASRYLTHLKKLKAPAAPLARLVGRLRPLGPHLGPLLYQLPPRWRVDLPRLTAFLARLPRDLLHVVEFRDGSWLVEPVRARLAEAGVGVCVHDAPGVEMPRWTTGPLAYVRFHGAREEVRRGYPDRVLDEWAAWLEAQRRAGREVYAYFNNDAEGHAVRDARRLRERLEGA